MLWDLFFEIYALRSVLWDLCFEIYALRSMLWDLFFEIYALRSKLWDLCFEIYALISSWNSFVLFLNSVFIFHDDEMLLEFFQGQGPIGPPPPYTPTAGPSRVTGGPPQGKRQKSFDPKIGAFVITATQKFSTFVHPARLRRLWNEPASKPFIEQKEQ